MESNKQHFRHILLFYYRKGKNAVQARKKLTDVYGEDVLTVRQCQNWFAKFRSGNFDVEDAPRSGRPVEAKDTIKALVDANWRITTCEIGERLNLFIIRKLSFIFTKKKNEITFRTTQCIIREMEVHTDASINSWSCTSAVTNWRYLR